jgi:hypothetical protein
MSKVNYEVTYPQSDEGVAFQEKANPTYVSAVRFVANYAETRAGMGDISTEQVLEEFKKNVCIEMRRGFDTLGTQ